MVLWLIGGQVAVNAYQKEYIIDSGQIDESYGSISILVLWLGITAGRVGGVFLQSRIKSTDALYTQLGYILAIGAVFTSLPLFSSTSSAVLWTQIAGYGLFNGPTVGYSYDLVNRITVTSEKGMAIVMFGLNFGASLVPYFVSICYQWFGYESLPSLLFISMLIPLPLMHLTKFYAPLVNRVPVPASPVEPNSSVDAEANRGRSDDVSTTRTRRVL